VDVGERRVTDPAGRAWWWIAGPALFVVLLEMFMVSYGDGTGLRPPTDPQLILILLAASTLLFRRLWPLPVAVVAVLFETVMPFFPPHTIITPAASIVAVFTLATRVDRRTAWLTGAVASLSLTLGDLPWQPDLFGDIHNVLPVNYIVIAIAVGDAVRSRRNLLLQVEERALQAERTRDQEAQRRVQEERIRIARDLHDVVAHHITLVNAQAGVAHHLLQSHPEKAYQALADIRETSRTALDELRATVGLLRQDNDPPESLQPAPRFDQLDDLIGSFRSAGFEVRLTRQGDARPLTGTADLAAYRIVQEALTNAGKHGARPQADVDLTYTETTLQLAISNPFQPGHRGPGTGHGLIGMRERADAAGGQFTAAPAPDQRFVVRVTLPLVASH
jgi:signal transduction histidine kinase